VPFGDAAPSPRTLRALRAAQQKGIRVIIATGRALFSAKSVLDGFVPDYYVCANGGLVADRSGAAVQKSDFTTEEMYALVDFCEDYDLALDFIYDDGYYAYVEYAYFKEHYGPFQGNQGFLHDGENQTRHRQSMPYGCSAFLSAAHRAQFSEKYAHLGLRFVSFHGDHCDVLRTDVDKAVVLTALLSRLGIGWEQVAAFGDGNNDVEMLQHAGLSVAMEN
ncbi:MAG: HAD hydrolase family protein, partial [Ruthenibacterium sp.]